MQTWDAITSHRNVRAFDGRPVPAADLGGGQTLPLAAHPV